MKPRFQTEVPLEASPDGLIDSEGLDASEQMFAASLEAPASRPIFTVSEDAGSGRIAHIEESNSSIQIEPKQELNLIAETQEPTRMTSADDSWKQEITARVHRYRARRPRTPRYPSLLLKFEDAPRPEPVVAEPSSVPINLQAVVEELLLPKEPEVTGRVIEFPRSIMAPPRPLEELAGPVPALPRILEVPEAPVPPPALGGILIDGVKIDESLRRPGFEIPLQASSVMRRILAATVDFTLVLCALVEFAYIFFRVTHTIPSTSSVAVVGVALGALLWCGYQYAFLVYRGSTPGLIATRLQLTYFDGRPVPLRRRRWRALASMLSFASVGLGYFWCFLDEDQLCWHDRITTTYIAPKPRQNV